MVNALESCCDYILEYLNSSLYKTISEDTLLIINLLIRATKVELS